ncbi:hypothetical protein [Deinococcus cellulosilyticus]|uniref:Uncharacterized protein n=1 Tax=Deinococcus cellulosilyticus (strain DSM 18568 / NBRC 106333 / KACC 11606 / 5516J-15) TaxID=1223518 RepID=A0A511N0I3_DEIC1|nr:hypothetical protein [Deinococcus cellulosilyticus]GEM46364.1 hypothetical protein DC3_19990 [Deinococcus cellulosilyticus NBRC 106333 = KACC 11606]
MTRQQHGYLNGCPVTGQVEQVQVAGKVTLQGRVHLIHPHHVDLLQDTAEWTYTGTCRDLDGGFLYVSEPVHLSILSRPEESGGWFLERCG